MTNNTPDYEDNLYFDSQNTKNEQQKDLCITSEQLTEQWKKRTLPSGVYYIKLIGGDILPAFCNTEYILKQFQTMRGIYDMADIEVLAPVPSYEEWEQLQNWANFTNDYHELREKLEIAEYEKAELKEQINKCCLDAINRGTVNAVKAVKEFGMPERIKELVEQNAQLKELLKKANKFLKDYGFTFDGKDCAEAFKVHTKINEVLR